MPRGSNQVDMKPETTKSRIFGMDYDELEKQMLDKRSLLKSSKESVKNVGKTVNNDAELTGTLEQENIVVENLEQRPRSYLDAEYFDSASRTRDLQIQQKKWLDDQINERKLIKDNEKIADKKLQQSTSRQDDQTNSQMNKLLTDKRDVDQQIQEYNMKAANLKREKEKKEKEQ
ncbi:CLUMA_CG021408, isoform A [Clunio marinus]|uniref:CLUMA_CG021408, isoform A n=1 Tax=Clunio marinus TaxID=568069 RepID=A0A1J1J8E7_9DIPT|nr:CLUMA_CG021408, isoform A [Clunio marinus]